MIAQAFDPLRFIPADPAIDGIVMDLEKLADGRDGILLGIELDTLDALEVLAPARGAAQNRIQCVELLGRQGQLFHKHRLLKLRRSEKKRGIIDIQHPI